MAAAPRYCNWTLAGLAAVLHRQCVRVVVLGRQVGVLYPQHRRAYRVGPEKLVEHAVVVVLKQCSDLHRQSAPNKRDCGEEHDETSRTHSPCLNFEILE